MDPTFLLVRRGRIRSTLTVDQGNVNETAGVGSTLSGAASKLLGLVLLLRNLRGLSADTAGVCQTSVNFSHFSIICVVNSSCGYSTEANN